MSCKLAKISIKIGTFLVTSLVGIVIYAQQCEYLFEKKFQMEGAFKGGGIKYFEVSISQ